MFLGSYAFSIFQMHLQYLPVLLHLWSCSFLEGFRGFLGWVESKVSWSSACLLPWLQHAVCVFCALPANLFHIWQPGVSKWEAGSGRDHTGHNTNRRSAPERKWDKGEETGCGFVVAEASISTWHISLISDDNIMVILWLSTVNILHIVPLIITRAGLPYALLVM